MNKKIVTVEELLSKDLKRSIGICAGGFDFLHSGHIIHFNFARSYCSTLIVAINSDESFPDKGPDRPFLREEIRADVIASIEAVSYVVVYKGPFLNENESIGIIHGKIQNTPYIPLKLIEEIKPEFYFKGIEYEGKNIPEIEVVERNGGKIIFGPKEPVFSASDYLKGFKK